LYYTMSEGQKPSQARVAFAIVVGMALCCAVMYVTADGAEEATLLHYKSFHYKSEGYHERKYQQMKYDDKHSVMAQTSDLGTNQAVGTATGKEIKVESTDVKKVNTIYTTDVPGGGRTKLINYFKLVEAKIAAETASREQDVANIRNQMQKNREYNSKARAAMRKTLMHKMAVNAKIAADALHEQMRITASKFKAMREVENRRHKMDIARFRKTRKMMRANKRAAQHALHMATLNQQRALAALDSATNAKIRSTNKHIAANSAQITANAAAARKALDHAMNRFDKKMFNAKAEAKDQRSKLAALSLQMDKKFRADISNSVRSATQAAATEFQQVRAKMAEDRHHADTALANAQTRITSAMNAQAALQDKRFAQTVSDIADARKEADERVKAASASFKMNILHLRSVALEQTAKLTQRQTQLSGVVTSNRLEQAKVNNNVNAELKRINKVGMEREHTLDLQNQALAAAMQKNKESNAKKMGEMESQFMTALNKIRAQAAKDRKYNEHRLAKTTDGLYATLKANQDAQAKVNAELSAATRQMAMDAASQLKEAKASFSSRLGALTTTVKKNDAAADKAIEHLTGVEKANAMKSAKGRELLKMQQKANKLELKKSIRDAVAKGEARAKQIEGKMKKANDKTRAKLDQQITTEIGTLSKQIHADIEELQFATKKARAMMKEEIVTSLRSEAKILKANLAKTVKWSNKQLAGLEEKLASEEATSASGRAVLKQRIAEEKKVAMTAISDAMAAQARGILALEQETDIAIKKTNTRIDAYGAAMEAQAKKVAAIMKANAKTLEDKVAAAQAATENQLTKANMESIKRKEKALAATRSGIEAATKAADIKFGEVYAQMGIDRAKADERLASATKQLNEKLASHSALSDTQFATTVTNLKKAKQEAWDAVVFAKKEFTEGIAAVTSNVKASESRVMGEIQVVSAMVLADAAENARVNARTDAEMKRVMKLSDKNFSESKRARGALQKLMNENKQIAHDEVAALAAKAKAGVEKTRSDQDSLMKAAADDLKEATAGLYARMAEDDNKQKAAMEKLNGELTLTSASAAAQLKKAKQEFAVKQHILTDTITANHKKYEAGLKRVTGIAMDWKSSSAKDRVLIRDEAAVMNKDLNKAIVKAIQQGEARAKEVLARATHEINQWKEATTIEIGERVENMADQVFATVNGNRKVMANNYLAVKGYAAAAGAKIMDYIQGGKGKRLLSLGDFLQSVAIVSHIKTKPEAGVSAGSGVMQPAFGGKPLKESATINQVNGLANEFMRTYTQVRQRWPDGLGKYLLVKLADSMAKGGILSVGKKSGAAGQWVSVTGKALGLSNRVDEFEKLGVRINHYQDAILKLQEHLPKTKSISTPLEVAPPEWQGN